MRLEELYVAIDKSSDWALFVADMSGSRIAYCNNSYPWDEIPNPVKQMEVKKITPSLTLFARVDFTAEAAYQSEERCVMDGYEKVYEDKLRGPVYAKETENGYSFAVIEGYC